jgi:HEPN domain-containing protein
MVEQMGKILRPNNPTVKSVEDYISFLQESVKEGEKIGFRPANVPIIQKIDSQEFEERVKKSKYSDFVLWADYHYFISRILFLHRINEYAFFCGLQCIENYLKAYLKFKNQHPPKTHDLSRLVTICRAIAPYSDTFIHSDYISTIISKFEPFYEFARYPVQTQRPKGSFAFFFPHDIYILDYFVMKMREILAIPSEAWNIFIKGHIFLFQCQDSFPDFYNHFFSDNINFPEKNQG